ncbi:glycosyltransferase family 4 protein [Pedobacter rhodius]|uniref:Glycosyltransferase family 4 protein n=1 Tax=Pedobacter rhodius TaxID=3004098 RepID=A0ABT4KVQ9_9SPHI|nr:glycosyltransferase family 4 protein [Pedobacter sp. SJ11]MCZ4223002.1 glycosyltransferase family 4 protein [Pedobacter sp. SJ11]
MGVQQKKILHAIRQGKVGGGETHVLNLVEELDKQKYESVILSFTEGPMVEKLKAEGYKTYVVNTETPFDFRVWKKVKKIIEAEKIDLIHAHGTRANSNTFYSAKSLKIPLIYTVHGWSFHPDQGKMVKTIRTLSERFLVHVADKTICVSESNLREGKSKFPMPDSIVVLNGINRVKFNPDKVYKDIRSELGIKDTDVVVGYIARITHQKSPIAFIHAIANLEASENVKFLIVGDGDLKPQMLKLSDELHLKNIIFIDFREDIPDILNAINIFCLPSLWEGLPIALLEAMSMRKAIIASEIDGINDLISNDDNGILVPPRDIRRLSEALNQLIRNEPLRTNLGSKAEKTVKDQFNVEVMTKKIELIYEDVFLNYKR